MKLKNKQTGEIKDYYLIIDDYNSLAELCEEWEDYEEPKEFWHISCEGKINRVPYDEHCYYPEKEIGNYFETKEEAEKVVDKLKALTRLGITSDSCSYRYAGTNESRSGIDSFAYKISIDFETLPDKKDLDLLFGGEE